MHRRTKPASDVSEDEEVGGECLSSFIIIFPDIVAFGNGVFDVQLVLFVGALVLLLLDRLWNDAFSGR